MFENYNPYSQLAFFAGVMIFTAVSMNPPVLAASFLLSFCYMLRLKGGKGLSFFLKFVLPVMLLSMIINPMFSHSGQTILLYLPDDNPLTLESIIYGIAAAAAISSAVMWFSCFNQIMTSDRIIYAFSRLAPSATLIFTMALGFIPRLKRDVKSISDALTQFEKSEKRFPKIRKGLKVFSAASSNALEGAVITAHSMNARGFATGKRSSFRLFTAARRDIGYLAFTALISAFLIYCIINGSFKAQFYPSLSFNNSPLGLLSAIAFTAFAASPLLLDLKEDVKWHFLKSKI